MVLRQLWSLILVMLLVGYHLTLHNPTNTPLEVNYLTLSLSHFTSVFLSFTHSLLDFYYFFFLLSRSFLFLFVYLICLSNVYEREVTFINLLCFLSTLFMFHHSSLTFDLYLCAISYLSRILFPFLFSPFSSSFKVKFKNEKVNKLLNALNLMLNLPNIYLRNL